jgi:hypothetical protein
MLPRGMVIKVGIDQGADHKVLRRLQREGLVELRQANELEQTWERYVTQQKKGIMLGSWNLGADVLVGDEVFEAEKIIGPGKRLDVAHIYAAYLNECEYFVTEDTDFLDQRDELEALLGVKIRRTRELLQEVPQE